MNREVMAACDRARRPSLPLTVYAANGKGPSAALGLDVRWDFDWLSGCATAPIFWMRGSSIRSGAPLPPGRCRSRREAREAEEGRGELKLVRGRKIARFGFDPFLLPETPDDPD